MAEDGAADDLFGLSVALSGFVLLAGAPFDDIGSNNGQGSAYIFGDSNLASAPHGKLIASDGAPMITLASQLRLMAAPRL